MRFIDVVMHKNLADGCRRGKEGTSSLIIGPLAAIMLLAAACGGSSASSNVATGGGSASTVAANSGGSAPLNTYLDSLKSIPAFKAPGPKVNASKLAGKTVVSIDCDPNAAPPAQTTGGTVSAGKAAGIHVTVLGGGNVNIPLDIQFMDQAINLKPIAIILVACVPPLLTVPLKAAKAAGIPVVVANYIGPVPSAPGQGAGPLAFGVATQPNSLEGTILSKEVAAAGPKNAQVGFISSNEIAESSEVETAFKAGLVKYCSGCKLVDSQNVNPGNWATSLSSTVSSMLISHPKLKYIVPVFDGMAPFVSSALGSSGGGHKVKIITTRGSVGAALTDVKNGSFMSDIGSSNVWVGWAAIDQCIRAALKLPPESNPYIPLRLETSTSIAAVNVKSDASVYGVSYVQGFKKLWGLG